MVYIKEHLEKCFPNINIIESIFYYIIDSDKPDNTIIKECKKNSIGVYGFKIESNIFNILNNDLLALNKFSKFNSCFIFKSDANLEKNIINFIDSKEPILFDQIKSNKLKKYYKQLFYRDLSITDKFYLYEDLTLNFDLYKHLTNYAILIYINDSKKVIQYIILNENKILDYISDEIKDIKDIDGFDLIKNDLRLVTFLIPMKLKKKYM